MTSFHTAIDNDQETSNWQLIYAKLAGIEASLNRLPQPSNGAAWSDSALAVVVQSAYGARRRRSRYFEEVLFGEPAWDMLLDLFLHCALKRQVNVTSLCLAANVPQATGLRYMAIMEKLGLISRFPSLHDRRVIFVELTQKGYNQMRSYVVDGIAKFDLPAT